MISSTAKFAQTAPIQNTPSVTKSVPTAKIGQIAVVRPTDIPPLVCDFGWYYGTSSRLPEASYSVGARTYPPAVTTLSAGVTLPVATVTVGSTAGFQPSGSFVIQGAASHATVNYTGLTGTTFTGCTGGTGTFLTGNAVYEPRYYVDQTPLGLVVTFDAIDHNGLGLPTVIVPPGAPVVSYRWDFGNGQLGYGPFASTTYVYNQPVPSIQATLTVTDALGRTYSCGHRLNIQTNTVVWGTVHQRAG